MIGIGHSTPFPSQNALGPHCSTALVAMYHWSFRSSAIGQTVRLGYLSWLALMAGVVALLRACGRGRCGWEPTALVLLACIPAVWMPLVQFFHPQDLLAMGLALGSVACARRGWWAWAGILVALAITSQQFALLVAAPLIVIVPANRRVRFAAAAIAAAMLVIVPVVAVTSGRAFQAVVLGSGNTSTMAGIVGENHVPGALLVILSRILPIALSMVLARWALHRLGSAVFDPVPLLSLVATSLSFRLVFERNISYYFMALAVSLVLLDVVRGRIRWPLVVWLALVTPAFSAASWGFALTAEPWGIQWRECFPLMAMALAVVLVGFDSIGGRMRWNLVAWLIGVGMVIANLPPWAGTGLSHPLPTWFWQLGLLVAGVAMAVGPLVASARNDPGGVTCKWRGITVQSGRCFRTEAGSDLESIKS